MCAFVESILEHLGTSPSLLMPQVENVLSTEYLLWFLEIVWYVKTGEKTYPATLETG